MAGEKDPQQDSISAANLRKVRPVLSSEMQMFHIRSVHASCCVGTKNQHQSPHAVTSKVGRRSECLALTQRKQSCHVLTIALATKDVSLVVTHNAALIKTEQAEFMQKIKTKTFPLCLHSAGIQQRLTTPHQSYAKWS